MADDRGEAAASGLRLRDIELRRPPEIEKNWIVMPIVAVHPSSLARQAVRDLSLLIVVGSGKQPLIGWIADSASVAETMVARKRISDWQDILHYQISLLVLGVPYFGIFYVFGMNALKAVVLGFCAGVLTWSYLLMSCNRRQKRVVEKLRLLAPVEMPADLQAAAARALTSRKRTRIFGALAAKAVGTAIGSGWEGALAEGILGAFSESIVEEIYEHTLRSHAEAYASS
ncbi:MAG TPA: hypothetical protein VMI56_28535 [Reyranella sp.]|nr:hypothetical protein [Reyranella sp.]